MPLRGEQIDFSRRTALYRLFDAEGRLLYVGIAFNPEARWRDHATEKPWWGNVIERRVEWHETRTGALKAEVAAIKAEAPAYNVIDADEPHLKHVVRKPGAPQSRQVKASDRDWTAYEAACWDKGLSRTADLRMYIKREVAAHKRRLREAASD